MEDFLQELNPQQREAVVNYQGPSLVIAGAGSGKTKVLTYRIAFMLHNGIKPRSVLALTFTNKAANEMKERIARVVGESRARDIWMGTFHSIFSRILRREADLIGFTKNFTIYDTADSKNLVKTIIKDLKLDDKQYNPATVFNRISFAKNNLITPEAYINNAEFIEYDKSTRRPRFADIYKLYTLRCKKSDAMDFDDLLLYTNILFRDFPQVLEKYQSQFGYILVDEYQDTNYAQYLIVKKLSALHHNVCVVGDDAQSIYSFRGAQIENILNYKRDYPECNVYKLEQNYRSTQLIVDAANTVIARNNHQITKKCFSQNEGGDRIKYLQAKSDTEEAYIVCREIKKAGETNIPLKENAILYRTNAQSRIFEEVLRSLNIPYKVYGSLSFYQRKEIRDVLAYFRLVINKRDDEALKRIINYPARGIGNTTINKLETLSNEHNIPIWEIITNQDTFNLDINKGTQAKLQSFIDFISTFTNNIESQDAYDLAYAIVRQSGILQDLDYKQTPENQPRYENVQELLNSIKEFSDSVREESEKVPLTTYMENVTLQTNDERDKEEEVDRVALMTIHSAKGLEFSNVYIVGVEEELFPSKNTVLSQRELEEERRLFYVALTRAKKRLMITCARERYKWGSLTVTSPSRFVKEIDKKFLDMPQEESIKHENRFQRNPGIDSTQPDNPFDTPTIISSPRKLVKIGSDTARRPMNASQEEYDDPSQIQVGMNVEHARFGKGKVIHIEGELPNAKATVFFQAEGQKQLLLKFAKLKVV